MECIINTKSSIKFIAYFIISTFISYPLLANEPSYNASSQPEQSLLSKEDPNLLDKAEAKTLNFKNKLISYAPFVGVYIGGTLGFAASLTTSLLASNALTYWFSGSHMLVKLFLFPWISQVTISGAIIGANFMKALTRQHNYLELRNLHRSSLLGITLGLTIIASNFLVNQNPDPGILMLATILPGILSATEGTAHLMSQLDKTSPL